MTRQAEVTRVDRGDNTAPLAYLVGAFFAIRLLIPIFVIRLLGGSPQLAAQGRLVLGFILFAIVALATLGMRRRTIRSFMRSWNIRWIAIFLVFSLCSFIWGEAASPFGSLAYWCGTSADIVTVLLLLCSDDITTIARSLMRGFIVATCIVAVVAWCMPTQYDLRLGDEDYLNSNSIGNLCAFGIFFAQYLMRSKSGKWTLVATFLALTLIRSLSKSTIIAFALSEIFLLAQDRTMSRRTKFLLVAAAVLGTAAFWGLFEAYFDLYTTRGNEAETLTGRTAIWAFALEGWFDRPWFGHGFDSMWNVAPVFNGGFEARHAENEILEQLYSYGVSGLVILTGVYASLYRRIRTYASPRYRVLFTSMIVFAIVRGLAEAEPFDLLLPLWTVALISVLAAVPDEDSEMVIEWEASQAESVVTA